MAGTWESQNKVLPGAYINIRTNEPLSITPGDRGTVIILQEISIGKDKELYRVTATESELLDATEADKKLLVEALKNAKTVLLYKLPKTHKVADVEEALTALKTVDWNVLCYPYDGESEDSVKTVIASYIKAMREEEGIKCQAVLANYPANSEGIINVTQGIILTGNNVLTVAEVTAWVAGITAGASMTESNTGKIYDGAIDVVPKKSKSEMEAAIQAGQFIFKVDSAQNVSVVYDINSLTTFSPKKSKIFRKNRLLRTIDNVANDITSIFESNYIGKVNNNQDGRILLKSALIDYFTTLQNLGVIQNFVPDDVLVNAGTELDVVVVDVALQPVDSVEKLYITVNLS